MVASSSADSIIFYQCLQGDEDETDGTMVKKTDQEGTMKAQPECMFKIISKRYIYIYIYTRGHGLNNVF